MRVYCLTAAALGWFGLVLQYAVAYGERRGFALLAGAINYFSYFTILCNLLAAATLTAAGIRGRGGSVRAGIAAWLTRPVVAGAIALYMTVTGLVYVTVLRHLWQPQGWHFVADALLHYAMPALYLVYWLAFVPRGQLQARHLPAWLGFPMVFAIYSLIHGAASGFYPYPFIDVVVLGLPRVLVNMALLMAGFGPLGLLLVAADRALAWRRGR